MAGQGAEGAEDKTPENETMMQAFEWYVPADHKHWQRLRNAVPGLKATGIDNMWVPPGCKASSSQGNGYDIYDLYDLGEFDQKGSRPTKWGSKEDLMQLIEKANEIGVGIYWDAVLNHKAAADETQKCLAVEVDPNGYNIYHVFRSVKLTVYRPYHFSGTDTNAKNQKNAIYRIEGNGKNWSQSVDKEKGNYDFLMYSDLDYNHPEVISDVLNWGTWLGKETGIKGIRFDAIKHFSEDFLRRFVESLDTNFGTGWFLVGEFWKDSLPDMCAYLSRMAHKFSLFDAPLVYSFSQLSTTEDSDLRKVFDNTLVQVEPYNAVTLVMNHDTQPYQSLEVRIEPFFKPLAYALILLRQSGYPCVFYGDLYGIRGDPSHNIQAFPPSCGGKLPDLCLARKLYAYGKQNDYFDYPTCIGWTREGTADYPYGLACVLSNARPGEKTMYVGYLHKGEVWTDVLGWEPSEVTIDEHGNGLFLCPGTSVAVWVKKDAPGRERFGKL
ncbi:hypothetical protein MMC34_004748 [Xylographa carneopallida]|nr:hypothetical protein [Xylographa carneopallida]